MSNYQNTYNNNTSLSAMNAQANFTPESLPNLFAEVSSSDLNPTMIDDWLADELCKSGLIPNAFDLFNGKHDLFSSVLPQTPLTAASPPSSAISDSGSSHAFSPVSENLQTQSQPQISLFPDIQLTPSSGTTTPPPPTTSKAVAPKAASLLPRIAPRPSTLLPSDSLSVIQPPTKRRLDAVKDNDEATLKRQKNTDAARRSRLKKLVKMEALENRVSELESDNNALTTRIAVLESEKSSLKSKDISLEERIRVLEAQLAEAHKALTKV
ncbi:hypothetical protein K501DRAFT_288964 [Backusella circina FSU 941]|nr:hypothetical protein K501DRAFT_288964 [Backusella circina FSU 941]